MYRGLQRSSWHISFNRGNTGAAKNNMNVDIANYQQAQNDKVSPIISRRKAKLLFFSSLIMSRCIKSLFFSRKSYDAKRFNKIKKMTSLSHAQSYVLLAGLACATFGESRPTLRYRSTTAASATKRMCL